MPFEDLSIVCNILNLSTKIQASPPGLLIKKFYRIRNLAVGGNWGAIEWMMMHFRPAGEMII